MRVGRGTVMFVYFMGVFPVPLDFEMFGLPVNSVPCLYDLAETIFDRIHLNVRYRNETVKNVHETVLRSSVSREAD